MSSSNKNSSLSEEDFQMVCAFCHDYVQYFLPLDQIKENDGMYEKSIIPGDMRVLLNQYVKPTLYEDTLKEIRKSLAGQKLFISISTSCDGHCNEKRIDIVNVSVGALKRNGPDRVFLINSVQKTSNSEQFFTKLFNDSLNIISPGKRNIVLKDILLIITDNEPGAIKFAAEIKKSNSLILHMISLDQTLFSFEQSIKSAYKKASQIVDAIFVLIFEQIELGSMTRAEFCAKLSLPKPLPFVYNSNENFIEMSLFVLDNFDRFKQFCSKVNYTVAIELRGMLNNSSYRTELIALKKKYYTFNSLMKLLRSRPIPPLAICVKAIDLFRGTLDLLPEEKMLADKLWEILSDDFGYKVLDRIAEYTGLFQHAPLVVQDRYRFPRFQIFKEMTEKVPTEFLYIYNVLYCYKEEEYFACGYNNYRKYKTWKFLSDNMITDEQY